LNARLELLMKPIQYVPSMAALDLTSGLANRDGALPLLLQARALFLQEDVGQQGQRPEAHDGDCAHQLIVIQPQFLFAIAEEDFDVPARSDMGEQGLSVALQIDFWPRSVLGRAGYPASGARSPLGSGRACEPRW